MDADHVGADFRNQNALSRVQEMYSDVFVQACEDLPSYSVANILVKVAAETIMHRGARINILLFVIRHLVDELDQPPTQGHSTSFR